MSEFYEICIKAINLIKELGDRYSNNSLESVQTFKLNENAPYKHLSEHQQAQTEWTFIPMPNFYRFFTCKCLNKSLNNNNY